MRPDCETKEERFIRLAEARVNKIVKMLRLLGNLSNTANYAFSAEQADRIFSAVETEVASAKARFADPRERSRFTLQEEEPGNNN